MNALMNSTIEDLRGGHQTWRVFLLMMIPAFVTGIGAGLFPWS